MVASTYRDQGRWTRAEELFLKVVETRKAVLGEEHPSTLTSMNHLAYTYTNQERWAVADELQRQAVAGFKKSLGLQHPGTLAATSNLVQLQRMRGEAASNGPRQERASSSET